MARVLAGEVTVAGRRVLDPGAPVAPETAAIAVAGVPVAAAAPRTILLHKPRGVVTTRRDPEGRATVYDLVGDAGTYLAPVGRLDRASTGLLLLTNDSRLADWLLDPRHEVARVYIVTLRGELADDALARAVTGVVTGGERLAARRASVLKRSRRETHLRVELTEGRNRELRRLFAALGHDVTRLSRVSFGGLALGTLAPGRWREVTPADLRRAFPGAPVRG